MHLAQGFFADLLVHSLRMPTKAQVTFSVALGLEPSIICLDLQ